MLAFRIVLLVTAITALCSARAFGDEKCSFKPSFVAGQKFAYEYENVAEHMPLKTAPAPKPRPGQEAAPVEPLFAYTLITTLLFTVESVDADGAATMTMKPDEIQIAVLDSAALTSAGFTRKLAEAPSPLPKGAGYLPRLALALARSTLTIKVRADGTVAEADEGLADAYKIAQEEGKGREAARVIAPLLPNSIKRTLTLFFRVDRPGADGSFPARAPGETWEMTDRVPSRGGMDLLGTSTLKLESCNSFQATITGASVITVEPSAGEAGKQVDPAEGTPTIEEHTDKIEITWEMRRGMLQRRRRDSLLDIYAKAGEAKKNQSRVHTVTMIDLVEHPK